MKRGKFFTSMRSESWGQMTYGIRLEVGNDFPEPRIVKDGSIGMTSWQEELIVTYTFRYGQMRN